MFRNTKVKYEKEENNDRPSNGCSFFLNSLIIKDVLYHLRESLPSLLLINAQGCVPHGTRVRVQIQYYS